MVAVFSGGRGECRADESKNSRTRPRASNARARNPAARRRGAAPAGAEEVESAEVVAGFRHESPDGRELVRRESRGCGALVTVAGFVFRRLALTKSAGSSVP